MSKVLGQIAIALGGIMFLVVAVVLSFRGVPLLEAVCRAVVVMCVTAVVTAVFFRYFTSILYKFVAERVMQQSKKGQPALQKEANGGQGNTASKA
jgi:uncharacterized membrane protein (DUF106 family)